MTDLIRRRQEDADKNATSVGLEWVELPPEDTPFSFMATAMIVVGVLGVAPILIFTKGDWGLLLIFEAMCAGLTYLGLYLHNRRPSRGFDFNLLKDEVVLPYGRPARDRRPPAIERDYDGILGFEVVRWGRDRFAVKLMWKSGQHTLVTSNLYEGLALYVCVQLNELLKVALEASTRRTAAEAKEARLRTQTPDLPGLLDGQLETQRIRAARVIH